ncbi:MAG TPA: class I SAM-dependent methyltransferase [Sporosarcina psychrophila]|uniref:Class I SAM-dependent methyltransferase n=1 Tax=Sporosarcina psychrophila TaxID=1476 RepID=A0A921FXK5_SPOPS|nr:class I SAM-dependent methyltransferase [Sporosarcina psychrophila]
MSTVITTAGRPDDYSLKLAVKASEILGFPIVERKKQSVSRIQSTHGSDVIVAGKNRYDFYRIGMDEPFFFHPNSAAFRLKRLVNGETDPLIDITQLQKNDSFLDCTLGLGSDSIIASFITGENGKVFGIEADPAVAFITDQGLRSFPSESEQLVQAMNRIEVIQSEAVEFLRQQVDSSWDIVYMDPMFQTPIVESSNFTRLRQAGLHSSLTDEWIEQALRVCKRRIVVKDRFDSPIFKRFHMEQKIRPNTKFHFAFIKK